MKNSPCTNGNRSESWQFQQLYIVSFGQFLLYFSRTKEKFHQLQKEIRENIYDLNEFNRLIDELICATISFPVLKKLFWVVCIKRKLLKLCFLLIGPFSLQKPDLFDLFVKILNKYLPKSSLNLKISKAKRMRAQEIRLVQKLQALAGCMPDIKPLKYFGSVSIHIFEIRSF